MSIISQIGGQIVAAGTQLMDHLQSHICPVNTLGVVAICAVSFAVGAHRANTSLLTLRANLLDGACVGLTIAGAVHSQLHPILRVGCLVALGSAIGEVMAIDSANTASERLREYERVRTQVTQQVSTGMEELRQQNDRLQQENGSLSQKLGEYQSGARTIFMNPTDPSGPVMTSDQIHAFMENLQQDNRRLQGDFLLMRRRFRQYRLAAARLEPEQIPIVLQALVQENIRLQQENATLRALVETLQNQQPYVTITRHFSPM
jgi:hypothetical protein